MFARDEAATESPPVDDASVWRTADWTDDDSWIERLGHDDIAEIRQALRRLAERGLSWPSFAREDFSLPTLGPRLAAIADELERGRGFVLLRGLDRAGWSDEELTDIYWGLGLYFGDVIVQNTEGDRLGRVTDHGYSFAGNDPYKAGVRGHRTRVELPPHSDSADLVGLLCVNPARSGGESGVTSATAVYNEILSRHPEFMPPLMRGFYIDLVGKGLTPTETSRQPIPVFSWCEGRLSCRFNKRQIELGAEKAGTPLTPLEQAAVDAVQDIAEEPTFRLMMDFRRGDIQLLNNFVILHSRGVYEDFDEPENKRLLMRLWLNVPNGRPLHPALADRLNTGPRGAVAVRP